ncbi:MAG: HAMP domain-containing histidine kinase [Clostridia bacterium]|nr:HAMP domain-containing histidine kinase [Clostridia bacterium]
MKKRFKMKTPDTEVRSDNLQLYFIISIFIILSVSIGAAALLTMLIEWLTKTRVIVPTIVWMILLSIAMGMVLSLIFSRMFISPITRLSRAMQQVAQGDFSVRLDHPGHFGEMRQSYDHFNTMAKALGTIETLQSDFVSNVSHEFKTPINAIEGYAMLLQDADDPARQKEYVDKILVSTHRLGDLVNNILLLSKVDNQSIPAERVAYRLDEQLRQALLLHERKWSEKGLELDVDLAPMTYTGPQSLMLHVWSNLIDNAVKFDPPGGLLRLRLQALDDAVTVEVSDSGEGMTEEQLTHIFDRFYQADGSHQREGNGLGLALVKRILEATGGEIRAESTPGKGSRFTVTLK